MLELFNKVKSLVTNKNDTVLRYTNMVLVVFSSDEDQCTVSIYPDRTFTSIDLQVPKTKQDHQAHARCQNLLASLDFHMREKNPPTLFQVMMSMTDEQDTYTSKDHDTLSVRFQDNPESAVVCVEFYVDRTYKIISYNDPLGNPAKISAVKRCLDIIQKFNMTQQDNNKTTHT
jgi:chloramphenicol O-acetyltransferase